MRYLIVSDIHGALDSAEFIVNRFKELNCDYILCLGDVLYHGPRNDLPNNYNPKGVIKLFNELKDKIICVKGNCEAEVDQMVLDFKIHDYYDDTLNGITVHLEHGHHLDQYNGNHKLVLSGHTHIYKSECINNTTFVNPGSITLPKNNTSRSYAVLDESTLTVYDLNNFKIFEINL